MHKTQKTILDYLEVKNLSQSEYEHFCDENGLRYLSLSSLHKFERAVVKAKSEESHHLIGTLNGKSEV